MLGARELPHADVRDRREQRAAERRRDAQRMRAWRRPPRRGTRGASRARRPRVPSSTDAASERSARSPSTTAASIAVKTGCRYWIIVAFGERQFVIA